MTGFGPFYRFFRMAEVLTVPEFARRVKLSERTIRRRLAAGKIRGERAGGQTHWRIPISELKRYVGKDGNRQD